MFEKQLNSNIQESAGKLSVKRSISLALLDCVAKGSRDQGGNCIMARGQLCLTALFKLVEGTTMPQHKGVLICSIVIYTWSCQVSLWQCTNFRPHSDKSKTLQTVASAALLSCWELLEGMLYCWESQRSLTNVSESIICKQYF